MEYRLLRDITAGELAMDSWESEGEGYRSQDVIGRAGTLVHQVTTDDDGFGGLEVDGFSEDSFAVGFIPRDAVEPA